MKRELRQIVTVVSLGLFAALLYACGGGGGSDFPLYTGTGTGTGTVGLGVYSGKTTQATITEASAKDALTGMTDLVPSCTTTSVTAKMATDAQMTSALAIVYKTVRLMLPPTSAKQVGKSVALLSTTAPTPQNGACGGTLTYPTYSHVSGTTTVSVLLNNYCTVNSTTGNKTTMNGTVSAVDAGTPTASGPVTTSLTANIPSLTVVEKTAAGATVSSDSIAMTGFKYVPATGATADISNLPGAITMTSLEVKAVKGTKTTEFKFDNASVTTTKVGTDTQLSISGTVCRATSGCSALTSDTPLLIDSTQKIKSGVISFTGTGGSKATLTAVPGTTSQPQTFNVNVNGTTLTGTQLKCNGIGL